MGKTVEINLNLATVGTELVETINQIQEGLTAQFVRVSRNLNRIGKEIVHDVGSFFKDLVQAVQKGDWKKIFTFFDQGEELLARIKAYIGQLKESISGYVALDLKKILPEEGLNEVKRRVTAFTQFFADLKKSFAARDWEGVARYLLPEEIFTSVLQVKAGVGKAKEWVNSIKRAFMEEGLEAVFKQALPEDIFDQILRGKELYQKTKEWINEIKQAFMDGGIQEVLQKIFSQDFRENLLQTFGNLREWMQQIPTVFTEAFSNITLGLGNFFTQITGHIQVVWNFLSSLPTLFTHSFQALGSTLRSIIDFLIKMLSGAWQSIVGMITSIGKGLLGIPGRAEGGSVTANKPYIVGEKGPEIFVPGSSGYIVPNHQLSGYGTPLAAAPQVTVNIINNTGQPVTSREETHFDGQQYVVSVWLDALSRNVGGLRDVVMAGR